MTKKHTLSVDAFVYRQEDAVQTTAAPVVGEDGQRHVPGCHAINDVSLTCGCRWTVDDTCGECGVSHGPDEDCEIERARGPR